MLRDGTVIGAVSRNIPIQAALGRDNLAHPRRFGRVLAASGFRSRVCYVKTASAIRTPQYLFEHELVVGGAGAGSSLSFETVSLHREHALKRDGYETQRRSGACAADD